jgi:hypothetical protein
MKLLLILGVAALAMAVPVHGQDVPPSSNGNTENYITVPQENKLGSNLIGLDIYNDDDKVVGTIRDIALSPDGRETAYIVSVGGLLGMGERYIAVIPPAINVSYHETDKKWHAKMNVTPDQLKAAPEFKYTGPWNASRD